VKHHPIDWWWVKADGCDLISGLSESAKGIWTGDVDLNDGALEKQYIEYKTKLVTIENLQPSSVNLLSDLENQLQQLKRNMEFLHKCKKLL